jgi:hypothetical protein
VKRRQNRRSRQPVIRRPAPGSAANEPSSYDFCLRLDDSDKSEPIGIIIRKMLIMVPPTWTLWHLRALVEHHEGEWFAGRLVTLLEMARGRMVEGQSIGSLKDERFTVLVREEPAQ